MWALGSDLVIEITIFQLTVLTRYLPGEVAGSSRSSDWKRDVIWKRDGSNYFRLKFVGNRKVTFTSIYVGVQPTKSKKPRARVLRLFEGLCPQGAKDFKSGVRGHLPAGRQGKREPGTTLATFSHCKSHHARGVTGDQIKSGFLSSNLA